jgi:heptosyltransferase-3
MRGLTLKGEERILLIRTDHIGDVLLSLPVATALKRQFPELKVDMLVRSKVAPLLRGHPDLDEVIVSDNEDGSGRDKRLFSLRSELRSNRYDVAVVLHPTWRDALVPFLSGIPARIGTAYRAYSFLFNFKVGEHRKHSLKHESEYNLGLLRPLGIHYEKSGRPLPRVYLLSDELQKGREILEELGVSLERPLVILHPGSAGSSLRWPLRRFAELADLIVSKTEAQVFVSWGPGEKDLSRYLTRLVSAPVFSFPVPVDLRTLSSVYTQARLFVGNSTGPMHLAAAVGVPVIAVFSPVKATREVRWGPLGESHTVFVPPVKVCDSCQGEKCQYFDCMNRVLPEVIFDRVCDFVLPISTRQVERPSEQET